MNKVICDICGTSYPDTATNCPICGFERDGKFTLSDEEILRENGAVEDTNNVVKGGRFSHSNVHKRNKAVPAADIPSEDEAFEDEFEEEETPRKNSDKESNTGLIVVLVLLLVAIVAVIAYIYISFFAPQGDANLPDGTTEPKTSTSQATLSTPPATVPCTNLTVSETVITLDAIGNAWLLNVVPEPANTTDLVTYVSSDEKVATVSETGRITAVGPGTATVTVTCGDKVVTCSVTCSVAADPTTEPSTAPTTAPTTEPTTAPTTEPTTAPTEPPRAWGLNRDDITFRDGSLPWTLYYGSISKANVTFSSDDESVATFVNGVVTPVGNGTTTVHATYNGEKISCIIRVKFKTETTEPTEGATAPSTEATTAATTEATTAATTEATTEATTQATDAVG